MHTYSSLGLDAFFLNFGGFTDGLMVGWLKTGFFGATTFSIMTFNIMTFSIMTFSIKTFSIKGLFATLAINDPHHYDTQQNNKLY